MLVFSSYGSGKLWQVKARFQALLSVASEQQPCGVQVVEWVGLAGLFRAVFAEEVGDFVKPISLFHLLNPVVLLFETTSL